MRVLNSALISCALVICLLVPLAQSAPSERIAMAHPDKQALIGAWRLISINYSGPKGALTDPVFGPNPEGIIIYDRSGWMSVQIVTANRPAIAKPATRTSGVVTPDDAQLKAAALDSYYAYFGKWEYDAGTSVITHHLKSSLLPYETGQDYRREVTLDGAHLKLIARSQEMGEARQRTLLWERVESQ
jgi:hypothetical protein